MAHLKSLLKGLRVDLGQADRSGRVGAFTRDEEGAMFNFALLLFVAMLIVSGLSIDLMRTELNRTRIQATMDRALLAAAHPDQESDRKGVVLDYFARSGLGNFIKAEDVTVEVGADGTRVTGRAHMNVSTPFLKAVGVHYLTAPASGGAAKINQLTEVSLVVDVSGSMDKLATTGKTKIYELRKAAKEFSNLLLCNPNDPTKATECTLTKRKTSISLVPYSTQVNVGSTVLSKFTRNDSQNIAYCATFEDADFKETAVDPDVAIDQSAKFLRYGGNYKNNNGDAYLSCHTDSWREVVAFEDSPTDMETKINALNASGDTAIDIGMKWGTALLHHKAQPVVTSLIADQVVHGDFAGRPFNPATTASSKFLVLMTDGQNTNHHHLFDGFRTGLSPFWLNTYNDRDIMSVYRESSDSYQWFYPSTGETVWRPKPYGFQGANDCFPSRNGNKCTPYRTPENSITEQLTYEEFWAKKYTWGFLQRFDWLGAPGRKISNSDDSDGDGTKDIDQRLLDQCKAAKDSGMTIYTIEMETPDTATDAMQKCASVKGGERLHYKITQGDNSVNLSQVFSKIAEDINKLRLVN
ncbi:TadE/TadG family type IV pilus assembly protein [Aliiroseovarius sp. CAU 1755]